MAPKKKSPAAASKRPSAEVPEPPPDAQVPRQTSPTLLLQPPSDSQAESAEATPAPLAVPNAASALTGPVADPPPSETHGAGGTSAGDVEAAMDTSDSVRDHEHDPPEGGDEEVLDYEEDPNLAAPNTENGQPLSHGDIGPLVRVTDPSAMAAALEGSSGLPPSESERPGQPAAVRYVAAVLSTTGGLTEAHHKWACRRASSGQASRTLEACGNK